MTSLEVCVVLAGIVGFGLVSKRIEHWPLTMPMVFVAFGALTDAVGLVDLGVGEEGVALLGEVALAVLLFSDAVRIDVMHLQENLGIPSRLLSIGLPLSILLGAAGVAMLLPQFSWWEAALVAAILAPTDAALGQAVVEDQRVPVDIRQGLNVESGLNDGIALPAVLLFAALAEGENEGAEFWLTFLVRQVGGGVVMGVVVGAGGAWLLNRSARAGWIEGIYVQLATLSLALLALAGALVVDANGLIAAFVAGLSFGSAADNAEMRDEYTEDTGRLLSLLMFFVFGNIFLLPAIESFSLAVGVCVVASLTVMRMVPVAVALLGTGLPRSTKLFIGWFGPRGLASILFGLLLVEEGLPNADELFAVITWTVVASVMIHGATASLGVDRLTEKHRTLTPS